MGVGFASPAIALNATDEFLAVVVNLDGLSR
jgi:hypothetical protein